MHLKRWTTCLSCSLLALVFAPGSSEGKGKRQHKYLGAHPLSQSTDDGYCFIEFSHVHVKAPPAAHKTLYRDHHGQSHFVADPSPYGYEGETHSYYGHHPIAVEVTLGKEAHYEAGQDLEYCYLDGPHYHGFVPQPGLTFEAKGGVSWYIGELPAAYLRDKAKYKRGNRVYATVEVERPIVEIEAPPVGYVGPVLDIHLHSPGHGRHRGHVDGHVEAHVDVGIEVEMPHVEIGIGLPGVVVDDHHSHGKRHKRGKKHKRGKAKGNRRRIRW